jgi:hypothetical protein
MPGILRPDDPGLYRNQRGRIGADPIMQHDTGDRGRVLITTGEGVTGDAADTLEGWRNVFRPGSAAFGILVFGVILFLIHARADVALKGAVGR